MVQATSLKTRHRGYYNSSSFKMALFFTVLLGLSVTVLSYFGYYFNRASYVSITRTILDTDAINMQAWEKQNMLDHGLEAYDASGRIHLLTDEAGKRISGNIPAIPDKVSVLEEGTILFELPERDRLFAARVHTLPDGRVLALGLDVTEQAAKYSLMSWLAGISIVFLIMVTLTSFAISAFVVRRTGEIAKTANAIMDTGDLSRRIEIDARWDDIGYMAEILNRLLARIEQLMQGVRQVSNNIAHDLRTPLTRLRNNLETLQNLEALQNNPQIRHICENLMAEAEQILSTFAALLRIARIETGREKSQFGNVLLGQIVTDVCELYEPLALEKNINLKIETHEKAVQGDRDLLFQMLANLLDNAIKYTPEGGTIHIQLGSDAYTISDTGPGVPEEDLTRIFERFYRAEKSRTLPGTGLGLSLVSAIAQLHGYTIETRNLNPGFMVTVHF